jgi:hypothetical protein
MTKVQGVITTRFRALIALVLTGWILVLRTHPVRWGKPLPWTWIFAGILPTWAVVVINAAFYGFWFWAGIICALAPMRKEEKAVWLTSLANCELIAAAHLFPRIDGITRLTRTALCLIAFLAAAAILVSLWDERATKEPS